MRSFGESLVLAAVFTASLGVSLPGPAFSRQNDLQAEPLHVARQAGEARERPAGSAESTAQNAAPCGKCHSACEDGRVHEGRLASALPAGADLPLTAEGRTTCFTCHEPHRSDRAAGSAHLRMSNLRRELCLVCHSQGPDEGPCIRIVSPPDRSIVQDEHLALIGKASCRPEEALAVRLNGAEFHLPVKGGEFSTWLKLQDGVNRMEIAQAGRVLWTGEVFHGEGASSGYGRKSSDHCTHSREECLGCHDDHGEKTAGNAGDLSALCYRCHERFEGKRYLHGPLAVGACLACHDPHSGYGTAHLRDEQPVLCGGCHSARESATAAACNASGKPCADCHDPHQSDSRYLLRGPKYTLLSAPAAR